MHHTNFLFFSPIAWWCLDHLPRKKSNSNVFNQRQGRRVSVPTLDTYNPFQRRRRTSTSETLMGPIISPGMIFLRFHWNNCKSNWVSHNFLEGSLEGSQGFHLRNSGKI